jgi:hypothetical protein
VAQVTYTFAPDFSVRTFGIAGLIDAGGVVLLAFGVAFDLTVLIVFGAVLMACGLTLMITILLLRRRLTTTVLIGDDEIRITSGGTAASARWSEIKNVSTQRQTIYLVRSPDQPPLKIDSPKGESDPKLAAISQELVERLDNSRGYRAL